MRNPMLRTKKNAVIASIINGSFLAAQPPTLAAGHGFTAAHIAP
jgi:hypothetical protein